MLEIRFDCSSVEEFRRRIGDTEVEDCQQYLVCGGVFTAAEEVKLRAGMISELRALDRKIGFAVERARADKYFPLLGERIDAVDANGAVARIRDNANDHQRIGFACPALHRPAELHSR